MKLEICAYSIESCINAKEAGAQRVELCASPQEGGTTPSLGMIAEACRVLKENTQKPLELYVMIRPRGGDFVYTEQEFNVMQHDITIIGESGYKVDGVVLGILTQDGKVDIERNAKLINLAKKYNLSTTFHRAADRAVDTPHKIVEDVIKTGACRILTSGQKPVAPDGMENIRKMVETAAGRIEIMCGSGVTSANAQSLATTGVDAEHTTAKAYRKSTVKNIMNEDDSIMYANKTDIMEILKKLKLLILFVLISFITYAIPQDYRKCKEISKNKNITKEEREALDFLYKYSPLEDITLYGPDFWIDNVKLTYKIKNCTPWGKTIPQSIFKHYVLPLRVNNEAIDSARTVFWRELEPRISKCTTMEEAALAVNHWCHEKANYQPTDARTCSPTAMLLRTYGRCGEESVFAVAALRAAGLPARQIYTPRWAHCDDNHAWIEVWIDGQWKYLGACEPEPALNMAWFTFPASRGLFMQTKVFGRYSGTEEVVKNDYLTTYINATATYAETSKPVIKVTDANGNPVEGATVDYRVYNYSEFCPVATLTTDKNGETSLTIGNGDWVIWASKDNKYNFVKLNPKGMDVIEIKLNINNSHIYNTQLSIVPPAGKIMSLTVNDHDRIINDSLLAHEDAIRAEYASTFIKKEESDAIAIKYGYNNAQKQLLWELLQNSFGNYAQIKDFLAQVYNSKKLPNGKMKTALYLLDAIEKKDVQDFKADMLFSHLCNSINTLSQQSLKELSAPELCGESMILKNVISPRISTEELTIWRPQIYNWLKKNKVTGKKNTTPEAQAKAVVNFVKSAVKTDQTSGRGDVHENPMSMLKRLRGEKKSADIFLVASLRAAGIPARLNPVDNKPQYFAGDWTTCNIFDNTAAENNAAGNTANYGYLSLTCKEHNPLYYVNFTVSKMENGRPKLLDLGSSAEGDMGPGMRIESIFAQPVKLEAGTYLLTTGNRRSDGSVKSELITLEIKGNETTQLEFELPYIAENFAPIVTIPELCQYLPLPDNNYTAVAIISSSNEPTNHMMRDISALSAEFEKYPVEFSFLLRNQAELSQFNANNKQLLPNNLRLLVDNDSKIENLISSALAKAVPDQIHASNIQLPLLVMVNKKGEVVYFSSGYKIGTGYQISKYLVSTDSNE